MRTFTPIAAAVAVPALALLLTACSAPPPSDAPTAAPDTIRFGVVPADTVEATLSNYEIFTELFEQETGFDIEIFEATNLAPVVEATIAGDLDLVMLGPFAQVMARDNGAKIETVGALIDSPAVENTTSVGLVRSDSTVTSLTDLAGEDVCFIDPGSASGYLFPSAGFLDVGIDPETDINAIFVGDHFSAVQAMQDGECAAVFTFGTNERYLADPTEFSEIWKVQVPNPGISISTTLDPDVKKIVSDAVLRITGDFAVEQDACTERATVDSDEGPVCQAIAAFWGVMPADDSYWDGLREVCRTTRAPACEE